jgi:pimeloyl-ACP methyl ester carboxylesterase
MDLRLRALAVAAESAVATPSSNVGVCPASVPEWRGGAELNLMRRIKAALDPRRIRNSGKLLRHRGLAVRLALLLLAVLLPTIAHAEQQWLTLPPTPNLPKPARSGYAPVNGVRIWYATFGAGANRGDPVLLLHGGLANADYWGNQVRELEKRYRVVVMDSRGHGRSTRNEQPYGYDLMASDVVGLMGFLKLRKAAIVGWSDGAIIGLDIAMNHPERVSKLFAFAANSDPSGVADIAHSPVFNAFIARAEQEYEALSPTPHDYKAFLAQITKMWETQPNWTAADLRKIAVPTWIVDADHDEAIKRENTLFMAASIPNAGLLIQPEVSDFSFLQDPEQFTSDVLHFLRHAKGN